MIMKKFVAIFFFMWAVAFLLLFVFVIAHTAVERALTYMTASLFFLWVVGCGSVMFFYSNQIQRFFITLPYSWKKKFVVFATVLALIEELITTTLTNMAPFFGTNIGEAYITASTNYFDVILFHSVIVFAPMFVAWSFLLSRYAFTPFSVFLLFGINGLIAEFFISGPYVILAAGFWIYVYGLMIYLPAYTIPSNRGALQPYLRHYALAIFLPIFFTIPVVIFVNIIHPFQPTHFPDKTIMRGKVIF